MFEDFVLIVYGLTVSIYFIAITILMLTGKWDKKIQAAAERVVEKVEKQSGFRFNVKAMAGFIEFSSIVTFLLPIVNTVFLLKTFAEKHRAHKAFNETTRKIVDDNTKFLDD